MLSGGQEEVSRMREAFRERKQYAMQDAPSREDLARNEAAKYNARLLERVLSFFRVRSALRKPPPAALMKRNGCAPRGTLRQRGYLRQTK